MSRTINVSTIPNILANFRKSIQISATKTTIKNFYVTNILHMKNIIDT